MKYAPSEFNHAKLSVGTVPSSSKMKLTTKSLCWAIAALQPLTAAALTIAEINGNKYLSPYSGQSVTNVTGLVVAKGPSGIWIRSTTPDKDPATSEAVYVFSSSVGKTLSVGDIITLDGKVSEYRSSPDYLYLTEIGSPKNVTVVSSNNTVTPLVIGKDTLSPPIVQYSSLDGGDVYALPNGVQNISVVNPVLKPKDFGLDFWESLSGELVTVRKPRVVTRPNSYGETWVAGDWTVTGTNKHGGVTMLDKGETFIPQPPQSREHDLARALFADHAIKIQTRRPSSSGLL